LKSKFSQGEDVGMPWIYGFNVHAIIQLLIEIEIITTIGYLYEYSTR
jgi:hypothetical protein